jgi:hypothetical protein
MPKNSILLASSGGHMAAAKLPSRRRNCGSTHLAPRRRSASPSSSACIARTPLGWIATPAPTSVSAVACS